MKRVPFAILPFTMLGVASSGYAQCGLDETARLTATSPATGDQFGRCAVRFGDRLLIGAPGADGAGDSSGASFVFCNDGTRWIEEQRLVAEDAAADDLFGSSVAIGEGVIIVGAPRTSMGKPASGAVYLFVFDGTQWQQLDKLGASDGSAGDLFGTSVALLGDTLIVGAPGRNGSTTDEGAAYVFLYNGAQWTESQVLDSSDANSGDRFGTTCVLSGSVAVIGAPFNDVQGNSDAGAAYLFRLVSGAWQQEQRLRALDGGTGDEFGSCVDLDGDKLIVGSPLHDATGSNAGAAYIYRFDGTSWTLSQKLLTTEPQADMRFGFSVAINGSRVIIGAPGRNERRGALYAFEETPSNWELVSVMEPTDLQEGDAYGQQVWLHEASLVCTAVTGDDSDGPWIPDCGAAYAYELHDLILHRIGFINPGDTVSLRSCGGEDDSASVLACVDVNGVTAWLPLRYGMFDDHGEWTLNETVPGGLSGLHIKLQSIALESDGEIVDSNRLSVAFPYNEDQKLLPAVGDASDQFGACSAIMGDVAVVGGSSVNPTIFQFDGSIWVERQQLSNLAPMIGYGLFGYSVAVGRGCIFVGLPAEFNGSPGVVMVYGNTGKRWTFTQQLRASDGRLGSGSRFGHSVAVSGPLAVIGAPQEDGRARDAGAAYVFRFDGTQWLEEQKLTASDAMAEDHYGESVAIWNNLVLVGSPGHDGVGFGSDSGSAYVYRFDGATWREEQLLASADSGHSNRFGQSVAIYGAFALVGSPYDDWKGESSGSVSAFRFDGITWNEEEKVAPSDLSGGDLFGFSVGLDSYTAVITSPEDGDGGEGSGSAYVFRFDGVAWSEWKKVIASNDNAGDRFGTSAALSGDAVIVGAPLSDTAGENSGVAYVFRPSTR